MSRVVLVVLLALAAVASARMAYVLPDGVEALLKGGTLETTFSCDNRTYGYYSDIDNDCQLFHVCLPISDDAGAVLETAHFTFACANQTVFNQESLTCSHPHEAFPCEESANLYDLSNSEFGDIPESR
ncbi:U-scoloptoxin(01)-Cw1a [Procambarus clarkii]|uniref:U-scoloptoxin(01)-Cw1a n=1 Tax=Procambarus clarkii TaxID=6728 RepID=UPI001E67345B|nr:U-scoloptoxin(01)-Cw1a-like [Procambarus clarkii]